MLPFFTEPLRCCATGSGRAYQILWHGVARTGKRVPVRDGEEQEAKTDVRFMSETCLCPFQLLGEAESWSWS